MLSFFADSNPLFSVVHNMNTSTINLITDLKQNRNWEIQWKRNFNPDPTKQAQEVIFSKKVQKTNHNPVYFNHDSFEQVLSQNILECILILNGIFRNTYITY